MKENNNRAAMTVQEFLDWAAIKKTTFYREVKAGRSSTRKVGRRTLVLIEDANRWLEGLPQGGDL